MFRYLSDAGEKRQRWDHRLMTDFSSLIRRVASDVNEPDLQRDIEQACRNKQAFCFGDADTCVVLKLQERDGANSRTTGRAVASWYGAEKRPESTENNVR